MRWLTLLLMGAMFLGMAQIQAQTLSKEEQKEWANKAKEYKKNPAALKELTEEKERYQRQADALLQQVEPLQNDLARKDAQINQLQSEVSRLRSDLTAAERAMQQMESEQATAAYTPKGNDLPMGLVFRVQLGAYKKTNVPGNLATDNSMTLETVDGVQKIMVGQFATMEEAEELATHFKKIGVKDAWVVPYRDGVRISLEELKKENN